MAVRSILFLIALIGAIPFAYSKPSFRSHQASSTADEVIDFANKLCQTEECRKIANDIVEAIKKTGDSGNDFWEYPSGKWGANPPIIPGIGKSNWEDDAVIEKRLFGNQEADEPIQEENVNEEADEPIQEEKVNEEMNEPIEEEKVNEETNEPIEEEEVNEEAEEPIQEETVNDEVDEPIQEEKINEEVTEDEKIEVPLKNEGGLDDYGFEGKTDGGEWKGNTFTPLKIIKNKFRYWLEKLEE